MLISVGLSAYLGYFVPMGVALYWVAGNFVAIVQQYFLNAIIPPKKHIDYAALEQSREKLRQLNETQTKVKRDPELVKREKEDYKRFFSIANKHLVFYSEKSGFYKYFQNTIDYLLNHSNVTIHYVTNDPNDQIFKIAKEKTRIKPYYIGPQKIITFMMKMDADIVVMTTPDLENYFIKRSYVRKDIEYIYMFHGMTSTNMVVRKGAYDHFDTIFCVGQHQIDELRESEKMYGLPEKNLIPCGYGMFDNLLEAYQKMEQRSDKQLQIMIAPSWQEGNILDTCLEQMLDVLQKKDCKAILRPHPEYIKRYPAKMERVRAICGKYDAGRLELQTDFSSNETIYTSDMLITDWSGIAHEFSYTTKRPSLFIDTPIKVLNEDYDKYQNKPMDITLRNQLGQSVPLDEMDRFEAVFDSVISQRDAYAKEIEEIVNRYVFNIGSSGKAVALYILKRLQKRKG